MRSQCNQFGVSHLLRQLESLKRQAEGLLIFPYTARSASLLRPSLSNYPSFRARSFLERSSRYEGD